MIIELNKQPKGMIQLRFTKYPNYNPSESKYSFCRLAAAKLKIATVERIISLFR